jgi:hypothetical protein
MITFASPEEAAPDSESRMTDALQFLLPEGAPAFLCPSCQCRLHYVGSRSNLTPDSEVSDRYVCPAGCGAYEYVRRTHRMRGTER